MGARPGRADGMALSAYPRDKSASPALRRKLPALRRLSCEEQQQHCRASAPHMHKHAQLNAIPIQAVVMATIRVKATIVKCIG